jgi:hypothetical protein
MLARISRRHAIRSLVCVLAFSAGCSDSLTPPLTSAADAGLSESEGRGVFQRYVAIGTSISMGWASDGVLATSQRSSWPVQLAQLGARDLTTPDLEFPGCRSPLAAPLASGRRVSGEPAGLDASLFSCAPLVEGTVLPPQNLAIAAATTYDALFTTPELQHDVFYSKLYPRILPPGMTQVTAMLAQNPKLVSVELGGNEVLNAREGAAVEGVTMYPYALWAPLYDAVLDSVTKTAKLVVVVGMTNDVGTIPAFRRGTELWNDRAAFSAAFNVAVSTDCMDSDNLLLVPVRVPVAVATGLAMRAHQQGPYQLSCAASADNTARDYVLDPAEANRVNDLMARMDVHIRAEAERRGLAYFRLGDLYDRADLKPPFSVVALMTSATPYGSYISLDGIHPSAAGSTVLADAAARALNARYRLGVPVSATFIASAAFDH